MNVIFEPGQKVPIKAWTEDVELEDAAQEQLIQTASLPFLFKHLAVMPDVHWGAGSTVGSVIATKGALVPAAVGVDIGCGMIAQRSTLRGSYLPTDLGPLRAEIEKRVPHGRTDNGGENDRGAWGNIPEHIIYQTGLFEERFKDLEASCSFDDRFRSRWTVHAALRHCGTLGSGNHFVEICIDEEGYVWIMLHSGSRGIGNAIGQYYIKKAQAECSKWFIELPNKDLAFLPEGTPLFDEYVAAVEWAQEYAKLNRALMMQAVRGALREICSKEQFYFDAGIINCHHNYVERENHFGQNVMITRKGAVRARKGDLGIIPSAMGRPSYIVEGLGNPESFMSCSHGAGRRMSRMEAKRRFTVEDHIAATEGLECRKDADVIDETPEAYKDGNAVMRAQRDLVKIKHTLQAVVCVKG